METIIKNYLVVFFLLFLGVDLSFAQGHGSVSVNQQGDGNKATIVNSGGSSAVDCKEEKHFTPEVGDKQNKIFVRKFGSIGDTLIYKKAYASFRFDGMLARSQYNYQASQNGLKNLIWIGFQDSKNEIDLSQSGNNNTISITSCKEYFF